MVDLGHIATLLVLVVATMAACVFASGDSWHAEILPLLVFAMTVAIAYDEDLALLLVAEVALVLVVGLGQGLADYITLTAAAAATIFWMGRIRSRSKLIYVGLWAGAVAMTTQIGANSLKNIRSTYTFSSKQHGLEYGHSSWLLMTGLLPFVEKTFGVLTDLSLLEIGDVAIHFFKSLFDEHQAHTTTLLMLPASERLQLMRSARGLLVRVGAYFMMWEDAQAAYYVENQNDRKTDTRHLPAMSSLIIIAMSKREPS